VHRSQESRFAWRSPPHSPLGARSVHVWRIPLDRAEVAAAYWPILSDEEKERGQRFYRELHRTRYVIAHGAMRRILAEYVNEPADELRFVVGSHGKPALDRSTGGTRVEFNLSHSDDLALLAVSRDAPVGVDLERWSEESEHLELAERFFSPLERDALRALASDKAMLVAGFFAAWSRKEAYLKATGEGISRGLHHFDVTLDPREPVALVADRFDHLAASRWQMVALDVAERFSAALVAAAPMEEVVQLDAGPINLNELESSASRARLELLLEK
jgi:4'-phosphopantetheinyl transferase